MMLYALSISMLPDGRFIIISSELATAVVPFSFHGWNQFKAIFRMMAIFHVCVSYDLHLSFIFPKYLFSGGTSTFSPE